MGNPIHINPPTAVRGLSIGGSNWLWVATAIFGVTALLVLAWSTFQPRGARAFHHIALAILFISTISYFTMASDLGKTPIFVEFRFNTHGPNRDIFWVRYVQWFINAPLILLLVLMTTGVCLSEIFITIVFALIAVVSGLAGALTESSYKWGFFVFAVLALFYVLWSVFLGTRSGYVQNKSHYSFAAGYIAFFWLLYPVCWGLSEGGNVISVASEMVFYGILDIFAGPVFLFFFLALLREYDYERFGLQSGKASDYVGGGGGGGGGPIREKEQEALPA